VVPVDLCGYSSLPSSLMRYIFILNLVGVGGGMSRRVLPPSLVVISGCPSLNFSPLSCRCLLEMFY
jgi:hypothetical protein